MRVHDCAVCEVPKISPLAWSRPVQPWPRPEAYSQLALRILTTQQPLDHDSRTSAARKKARAPTSH